MRIETRYISQLVLRRTGSLSLLHPSVLFLVLMRPQRCWNTLEQSFLSVKKRSDVKGAPWRNLEKKEGFEMGVFVCRARVPMHESCNAEQDRSVWGGEVRNGVLVCKLKQTAWNMNTLSFLVLNLKFGTLPCGLTALVLISGSLLKHSDSLNSHITSSLQES